MGTMAKMSVFCFLIVMKQGLFIPLEICIKLVIFFLFFFNLFLFIFVPQIWNVNIAYVTLYFIVM